MSGTPADVEGLMGCPVTASKTDAQKGFPKAAVEDCRCGAILRGDKHIGVCPHYISGGGSRGAAAAYSCP